MRSTSFTTSRAFVGLALVAAIAGCAHGQVGPAATPPTLVPDKSVRISGAIGRATNDVAPLPGTEMIRSGTVREREPSQPGIRSASQEAASRGGGTPTTTIIIEVVHP